MLGISLIISGLFLLCHHGYTQMNLVKEEDVDPEAPLDACKKPPTTTPKKNDCCLPICFFQTSQIYNHETWIVVCLLCGSTILLMSLVSQPAI